MPRKFAVLLTMLAAIGLGIGVSARAGKASGAEGLVAPYATKVGDLAALQIGSTLISLRAVDAPTSVHFDPSAKTVNVLIYGQRSSVEGAKEILEGVRAMLSKIAPQLKAQYGAEIDDTNVTLIYYNRNKDNAELLRREGGKYITP